MNLTPDAYNSLVNIYSVLSPEATRAEVARQFSEKQGVLKANSFKKTMSTLGVRESLLSNSHWKTFNVVLAESYLYFYKEESDLTPYYYLYVLSITSMTLDLY